MNYQGAVRQLLDVGDAAFNDGDAAGVQADPVGLRERDNVIDEEHYVI